MPSISSAGANSVASRIPSAFGTNDVLSRFDSSKSQSIGSNPEVILEQEYASPSDEGLVDAELQPTNEAHFSDARNEASRKLDADLNKARERVTKLKTDLKSKKTERDHQEQQYLTCKEDAKIPGLIEQFQKTKSEVFFINLELRQANYEYSQLEAASSLNKPSSFSHDTNDTLSRFDSSGSQKHDDEASKTLKFDLDEASARVEKLKSDIEALEIDLNLQEKRYSNCRGGAEQSKLLLEERNQIDLDLCSARRGLKGAQYNYLHLRITSFLSTLSEGQEVSPENASSTASLAPKNLTEKFDSASLTLA